ncbi:putative transposase y4bL/y4kJ/y4tB [Bacteroidia bacterium]|nr:putative transposase y4bL/y4kJ/y4tB [Bacteroidia bacterium]GHT63351.1 putative transposase y4bL/y4kJ/y4tB [Bacteroidia bacterium]
MSNTPIQMNKLRTIIRLYEEQTGLKTIAVMARTSRNTVKKYIQKWHTFGMSYETFQQKSEAELHDLFCVREGTLSSNPRMEELDSLIPGICKELSKRGMTTLQQWDKYRESHPDGYGLTQFRLAIQRYRKITHPSMRMEHKAGDKLFVDYCGDKLWIYPYHEPARQVEVFVAILGCSLLTYVEATDSQSKEDFICACENAFYYYGGVPQAVVPDNLKAAVTKAGRHESVLNEEFERFSEHYGVTVFPARVRKPKDKALVENAVKLTYKDIYTKIEPLHCPDLKSLNAAIRSALELHNNGTLTGRNYSRRTYFEDIERDVLGSLNPIRYQVKKQVSATVGKDGYIRLRDDAHFYSVPYTCIGKKLTIRYTSSDVEIFDNYTLVAKHTRSRIEFKHTTNPEHLCPGHKAILEWSPETFLKEASELHEDVEHYIRKILEEKRYVDQANKICSGILGLARKVGPMRLAAACRLADSYGRYSFLEIQNILKTKSERMELPEETTDIADHENIRGKEYYK